MSLATRLAVGVVAATVIALLAVWLADRPVELREGASDPGGGAGVTEAAPPPIAPIPDPDHVDPTPDVPPASHPSILEIRVTQ